MQNINEKKDPGAFYLILILLTAIMVLGAVSAYTSLKPMSFLEAGYPVWKAKEELLDTCDLGSLVVFGDSQADAAVIPGRLPERATNLGFAGGTPIEGYFFVKRSTVCKTKPNTLILSFGPGAFMTVQPWLWDNAVRFGLLGWDEIREIRESAEKIGDSTYYSVKTHDGLNGSIRDFLYATHFPSIYFNSLVEGRVYQRHQRNVEKFLEVKNTRGYPNYGNGSGGAGVLVPMKNDFKPFPIQQHFFEKTLAILNEKNVQVKFLITPLNESRLPAGEHQMIVEYINFLHGLEAKYPNFHLLQSSIPVWPRDMFTDGAHLNFTGAEKFSDLLNQCISESLSTSHEVSLGQCEFKPIQHTTQANLHAMKGA